MQNIKRRRTDEQVLDSMNKYLKYFTDLMESDPEKAKEIAKEHLQATGIIDERGELKPPYNGEKVNETDFTRGPKLKREKRN